MLPIHHTISMLEESIFPIVESHFSKLNHRFEAEFDQSISLHGRFILVLSSKFLVLTNISSTSTSVERILS